ncbi:ribonuclease H-like domain-containing protein [Tanacetum coccineum]
MVRSMCLFKHKLHADGTFSCYKARLVANGSSQQLGVDFDETFSLVVKPATICTVLSLVVSCKCQLDVKNAFLNGDLSKNVYMHQPPCFVDARQRSHVGYLFLYVDDIILTASSTTLLQHLIDSLHREFDMTDLGVLNYFLGISVVRHSTGKCVCNLGAVFEKKQEEEKFHTFLMSLVESVYGTAKSNILAQDPLPNLNKVYSILIQEERVNTMCFEIHGYPEWWGDRPHVDTKRNGAGRGLSSGRGKGRGGRGLETMNGKFSWIIDSGASHHMTGLIEKLINIKEIVEWPVELPDGRMVMANKEGNILFNSGTQFWRRDCAGKRWDGGLFYFREKPLVQALNTTLSISVDLWHKRLGHPSLEDINFLPGVSSSRKDRVIIENCEYTSGDIQKELLAIIANNVRKHIHGILKERFLDMVHGSIPSQRADADKSYSYMKSLEFVFILHLLQEITGRTNILSQSLQRKSQDIANAIELVSTTKKTLFKGEALVADEDLEDGFEFI